MPSPDPSDTHSATGASPHELKAVVAAVIEKEEALLICRRPQGKNHGGLWEFPGGKINPGESIQEAVARELEEELALETVMVGETLFTASDELSGYRIHFIPTKTIGEPVAREHSELAWCRREALLSYALAPSDLAFAQSLLGSS